MSESVSSGRCRHEGRSAWWKHHRVGIVNSAPKPCSHLVRCTGRVTCVGIASGRDDFPIDDMSPGLTCTNVHDQPRLVTMRSYDRCEVVPVY